MQYDTESMLTKLGDAVEAQTTRIKGMTEAVTRQDERVKQVESDLDKFIRQVPDGRNNRADLDPNYRRNGRVFPSQRAAANFAYLVGASLYRDSACLEQCEKRNIPVVYERSDGRRIDVLKTRDMQVGVDSEGGYAVVDDAMQIIWDVADEFGLFSEALFVPMTSLEKTILLPEDGIDMMFLDELEAATNSGITFGKAVLKAKKIGGYAVWSGEFGEDVAAFTGEQLAQLFGRALARKFDNCLFRGDGTSQFGGITGVLNHADTPLVPMPAGKIKMEDATIDDFLALKYGVPARIRRLADECAFIINPDAFYILESMKDGSGRPILTASAKDETERRLWGHRVIESSTYPDFGDDAPGLPFASFGALKRSYAVGIRRQLRLRRMAELFALQDAEAIVAFARFDIVPFAAHNMANLVTAEE